jgi:hypothetical protein
MYVRVANRPQVARSPACLPTCLPVRWLHHGAGRPAPDPPPTGRGRPIPMKSGLTLSALGRVDDAFNMGGRMPRGTGFARGLIRSRIYGGLH